MVEEIKRIASKFLRVLMFDFQEDKEEVLWQNLEVEGEVKEETFGEAMWWLGLVIVVIMFFSPFVVHLWIK